MKILTKHWPLLMTDPDLKEVITKYPSITYRRGKNI